MDKPFLKTQSKIVTITIEEDGSQTYLKTDSADIFMECGEVVTRRASHVEPAVWPERLLFSLLRTLFPDTSAVAAWTRTWRTVWRVNTKPVGGPILRVRDVNSHIDFTFYPEYGNQIAYWLDRQEAIDAEIVFLNQFFAERKI
jgi:hypothetical protein